MDMIRRKIFPSGQRQDWFVGNTTIAVFSLLLCMVFLLSLIKVRVVVFFARLCIGHTFVPPLQVSAGQTF